MKVSWATAMIPKGAIVMPKPTVAALSLLASAAVVQLRCERFIEQIELIQAMSARLSLAEVPLGALVDLKAACPQPAQKLLPG
jgi:hypothetical protein